MRLSTRLAILLAAIAAAVALSTGWYAVSTSSNAQYGQLRAAINAVAAAGLGHPVSALSDAINLVQQDNLNLSLELVNAAGTAVPVASGATALTGHPTLADVRASLDAPSSSADLPGFLYRSIAVGGGDYLVIAGSTVGVANAVHDLIWRTAGAGAAAALVLFVLARLALRRDLRTLEALTEYAARVAQGDLADPPARAGGSRDVRELAEALAVMVGALRRTIETEQRTTESMQRFIGDASHELRTPLTVVAGYTELLARDDLAPEARERALARVRSETDRMATLVSDLLFLAEARERPAVSDEVVDLSALCARAAEDFATDHPARRVEVSVAAGVAIEGREDWIARILANALSNVARHTAEDDPVRLSLRASADTVVLAVEDGGPGLPPEAYAGRDVQFRRFDPSRSRDSGGSGLGMSIMAEGTAALGGSLERRPSELGGLALVFRFPRRVAAG